MNLLKKYGGCFERFLKRLCDRGNTTLHAPKRDEDHITGLLLKNLNQVTIMGIYSK